MVNDYKHSFDTIDLVCIVTIILLLVTIWGYAYYILVLKC